MIDIDDLDDLGDSSYGIQPLTCGFDDNTSWYMEQL